MPSYKQMLSRNLRVVLVIPQGLWRLFHAIGLAPVAKLLQYIPKQNVAKALDKLNRSLTRVNWFVNYRGADHSNTADHNGFAVPSIPVLKGKFGSQNSLQASGSHGSLSDLSQTDSNPDLSSSTRKLSNQSITDQQTPRRGSATSAVSDKYELSFWGITWLILPLGCDFIFRLEALFDLLIALQ